MDETGKTTVQERGTIVTPTDQKTIGAVVVENQGRGPDVTGKTTIVICCMNELEFISHQCSILSGKNGFNSLSLAPLEHCMHVQRMVGEMMNYLNIDVIII